MAKDPRTRRHHADRWGKTAIPLLLALIAVAYGNSFTTPWVFDGADHHGDHFGAAGGLSPWQCLSRSMRPVGLATFLAQDALHGDVLWAYHAVNLAIHAFSAILLYAIVRRTLAAGRWTPRYADRAGAAALAVAALWAVHPLQTGSVTYLYQRYESLMGMFFLLSLYLLVRGIGGFRPYAWYAGSILAFLLAAATKEVAIVFPLVALWYDRTFAAGSWGELVRKRGGYYGVLGLCLLVPALYAAGRWARYVEGGLFAGSGVSVRDYALTQPGVLLHYLKLCFWPQGQCLDYHWPIAQTAAQIVPPLLVIGVLGAATLWAAMYRPAWGFLGGAFFLILAPTSSFLPIRDLAFEHRMYLPLAIVATAVVFAAIEIAERLPPLARLSPASRAKLLVGATAIALTALVATTFARNRLYGDEVALWTDVVAKSPSNGRAYVYLGNAVRPSDLQRATECFAAAVRLSPEIDQAHNNLGALLMRTRPDQAWAELQEALRLNPQNAEAHSNLGNLLARQQRFAEALEQYQRALEIRPDFQAARANRAIVLELQRASSRVTP
jgi:hypothetical protein